MRWVIICDRNCCSHDRHRITSSWIFSLFQSISFYLPISLAYFVRLLSPLCRSSWPSLSHSPFRSLTLASSLLPFVLSLSHFLIFSLSTWTLSSLCFQSKWFTIYPLLFTQSWGNFSFCVHLSPKYFHASTFFGSLHILICLLLFFLFLSFLCTLSSNSWSFVSLSLPNSHCGHFIPHAPFSISIYPSRAMSRLLI